MTKKDYELIALHVKVCIENEHNKRRFATEISELFKNQNPRFNRSRFLTACGVEAEK